MNSFSNKLFQYKWIKIKIKFILAFSSNLLLKLNEPKSESNANEQDCDSYPVSLFSFEIVTYIQFVLFFFLFFSFCSQSLVSPFSIRFLFHPKWATTVAFALPIVAHHNTYIKVMFVTFQIYLFYVRLNLLTTNDTWHNSEKKRPKN